MCVFCDSVSGEGQPGGDRALLASPQEKRAVTFAVPGIDAHHHHHVEATAIQRRDAVHPMLLQERLEARETTTSCIGPCLTSIPLGVSSRSCTATPPPSTCPMMPDLVDPRGCRCCRHRRCRRRGHSAATADAAATARHGRCRRVALNGALCGSVNGSCRTRKLVACMRTSAAASHAS